MLHTFFRLINYNNFKILCKQYNFKNYKNLFTFVSKTLSIVPTNSDVKPLVPYPFLCCKMKYGFALSVTLEKKLQNNFWKIHYFFLDGNGKVKFINKLASIIYTYK